MQSNLLTKSSGLYSKKQEGIGRQLVVPTSLLTEQSESTGNKIRVISVGPGKGCYYKAGNMGGRHDFRVL
jgi:hypothetical protein